jgi:hypothetical protein
MENVDGLTSGVHHKDRADYGKNLHRVAAVVEEGKRWVAVQIGLALVAIRHARLDRVTRQIDGFNRKHLLLLTAASSGLILLLSACSSNPPIVSADTSCERFRHISATPAQIKVYQDNWEVMESYADQVLAHNVEYDGKCLGVAP